MAHGKNGSSLQTRMVRIAGRELRVARWQAKATSDKAKPLLFFNGIGANLELIAPFAERLARDVVTFDLPGTGGSPDPVRPYRLSTMARAACGIVDEFGYGQVDVMGISWGGALAQQFALQYGKRTARLVLAATTAGMLMVPGKWSALSKMANPARYADPGFMAGNFKALYGGMDHGSDDHVMRINPPTARGYLYQLLAMAGWTSAPLLPFLSAETLILMGEHDAIVRPINGKILRALQPNARLVTIREGGHLFLMSHTDEVVPLVADFLDGGQGQSAYRIKASADLMV